MVVLLENKLSALIKDAAIEVHRRLGGPGLLESIYEEALFQELTFRGIPVERQVKVPVHYKGVQLATSFRIDLLIEKKVIIEVKATELNHSLHAAQTLTYLRASNLRLGLILNFGQQRLIDGFTRVVNNL